MVVLNTLVRKERGIPTKKGTHLCEMVYVIKVETRRELPIPHPFSKYHRTASARVLGTKKRAKPACRKPLRATLTVPSTQALLHAAISRHSKFHTGFVRLVARSWLVLACLASAKGKGKGREGGLAAARNGMLHGATFFKQLAPIDRGFKKANGVARLAAQKVAASNSALTRRTI